MKILGKYKCPNCNSVQNGISEADALAAVAAFNRYLETVASRELEEWYGSGKVSISNYKRCFFCDTPSDQFKPAFSSDGGATTNQPIIAPTKLPDKYVSPRF